MNSDWLPWNILVGANLDLKYRLVLGFGVA